MNVSPTTAVTAMALSLLVACGGAGDGQEPERRLPVTAAEVRTGDVEVVETTVGRIEAATAPTVAAEVAGRVVEVARDAGDTVGAGELLARIDDSNYRNAVQRLSALHEQQARTVRRYRDLVARESVSQSLLDEAEAQLDALDAQLRDARTDLDRTRVTAPVDGVIQRRFMSVGDFRGVGDPMYQVAALTRLRVSLPFPERVAGRLAIGQVVRLRVTSADVTVNAKISELRPMVGTGSRSLEAIVELDNPGNWRPGNSVSAEVVLATRTGQTLVPALSVVQRPAGSVVYVVDGDTARQRVIEPGVRTNGEVEVRGGLSAGERVVVDGAGFLTDGARISVQDAAG